MHVLATAGHVDHGKSTLVRALTGMEPDRLAEERRRGLTLDLGFAWTTIGDEVIALVDVPGHERFVPTMLAGVGPASAVLLVVAADGGWMPQSQEHLDALDALGVSHGLLVVTRCDLADPAAAERDARARLASTSLRGVAAVRVSATTGAGVPALRRALVDLVRGLPPADTAAPVRLWVDRAFTVKGAGTVVTGTLAAGTLRRGDHLRLSGSRPVSVRGLQSLGADAGLVAAPARVAVNLRGVSVEDVQRGHALMTPGHDLEMTEVDVRVSGAVVAAHLPRQCLLHLGSAHVGVRVRPLGGDVVRLVLDGGLAMRVGDRALLRDPGRHLVLGGVQVLDVDPPALRRRGAAAARAAVLSAVTDPHDVTTAVRQRGVVAREHLLAMGYPVRDVDPLAAEGVDPAWLVSPERTAADAALVPELLGRWAAGNPLDPGMPVELLRQRLQLPTPEHVRQLVEQRADHRWVVRDGSVVTAREPARATDVLPGPVQRAVRTLLDDLAAQPYVAAGADRLRELGLGPRELAAAVRVGALTRLAEGVYLTPLAVATAAEPLRALDQPFSPAQAGAAWGTSRRVSIPLLAALDARGLTNRRGDGTRTLVGRDHD